MRFLVRLPAFSVLLFALTLFGCSKDAPGPSDGMATVASTLKSGTEVPLILLRQIEAGRAETGLLVPFMVSEDVKDQAGNTLIPKGTVAEGEITWSRSEGTLSGLMRQPARLEVALKRTRAASNESVSLCADLESPDKAFAFTRENTGLPALSGAGSMDEALEAAVSKALADFAESGEVSDLNADDEARQWLIQASKEPGMEAARAFLDPDSPQKAQASELERVVKHLRDGSITQLAGGEVMLAVTALQELGNLAHSVERGLSAKLKGRTIKAYVGTPLTAFVAKDVAVKALQPK